MDSFKVIIAPEALEQLNACVRYIRCTLSNPSAAESVYNDAIETGAELAKVAASLKFCDNEKLSRYGYRAITFRHHQYLMIYRTAGQIAYVDGIFHQKQDYENLFARTHNLK
ncbi:MAG: type II toxin-antitoxin system RelE/ParE family toxin [Clostridiales bacterium]|nr:type II toxin-antitoxin system RelE/ParE family toxin [Clostridiales bacterium]